MLSFSENESTHIDLRAYTFKSYLHRVKSFISLTLDYFRIILIIIIDIAYTLAILSHLSDRLMDMQLIFF